MKHLKKYNFFICLALILILTVLLRFPFLKLFPPSMLQDEVGIGYSAISIAETGKDEWGESLPLFFKSFGDYKSPAFIYVTALLYKVIGWYEILPRITSAIAGFFIVLFGALWIKRLFKSKELGLIAGLLLATSPWTIHMSRMALESNLGLAFFMAGLFFMSYEDKSKGFSLKKIILSSIFFSLSSYSFHSYRYTVILFLVSIIVATILLFYKQLKQKKIFLKNTCLILLLSLVLSLPGFFAKGSTGRLNQTLILNSTEYKYLYKHYENNCHNTFIEINPHLTFICRLKYNKYTTPVLIGVDSLIKHLSPDFLFFSGDEGAFRNPTQSGHFYVFLFPFWMVGSLILFKNFKKNYISILGYILALLPSTVSGEPHATRLSILIPFVLVTLILGYQTLRAYFKKFKYFPQIYTLVTGICLASFVLNYSVDTFAEQADTASFLSYAKKVALLEGEYIKNGYVVYADQNLYPEPHIYYAYFNRIDPQLTQASFAQVYQESTGFSRPQQFGDNLFFYSADSKTFFDCQSDEDMQRVHITKNPIDGLTPATVVKDNTQLYGYAYVYEGSEICAKNKNQ